MEFLDYLKWKQLYWTIYIYVGVGFQEYWKNSSWCFTGRARTQCACRNRRWTYQVALTSKRLPPSEETFMALLRLLSARWAAKISCIPRAANRSPSSLLPSRQHRPRPPPSPWRASKPAVPNSASASALLSSPSLLIRDSSLRVFDCGFNRSFGSGCRTCVDVCPSQGYYVDTSSKECKRCHSSCASCTGPELDQCLVCAPSFLQLMDKNVCVQHCPTSYHFGYYSFILYLIISFPGPLIDWFIVWLTS